MTPTSRAIAVVYEHTKRTQEMCSPIGHNNTKRFLCPIRSRHRLELLEIVRWESVPRGSFTLTWKLSFRLFSRPDWLPLGLRGWKEPWLQLGTWKSVCVNKLRSGGSSYTKFCRLDYEILSGVGRKLLFQTGAWVSELRANCVAFG